MPLSPRLVAFVPPFAAAAALAVAGVSRTLAPGGAFPQPFWLAGLTALATAAALYRPVAGHGLGVGAALLPPVAVLSGAASAGWVAFLALAAAPLMRGLLERLSAHAGGGTDEGHSGTPPRDWTATLAAAGSGGLAALTAAALWRALAPPPGGLAASPYAPWAIAAGSVTFAGLLALLAWGERRLATGTAPAPWPLAAAVGWDLLGWLIGLPLALVAVEVNGGVAFLLALALVGLAVEAERNRWLSAAVGRRLADLDRVSRAGHAITASGAELDGVVERIRRGCADSVPFVWFSFELVAPGVERQVWSARDREPLGLGEPTPEEHPPALPGVHKRSSWRRIERDLVAEGTRVARLTLWSDPRLLAPGDVDLLDRLVPQMAGSVERALLDREARSDPLTRTAVRRVFDRRLEEAYALASEAGHPVAVVMCDLDHFKRINDSFGHSTGDLALREAAAALEGARREADLLARYGGEEFTLLLEKTDGAGALQVAERLRAAVEAVELEDASGRPIPLTLSAGVAAAPELFVRTATELLLLADDALYEAKERGRNLCLLDLGQGRYQAPDGTLYETDDRPPPAEPPRIFA